MQIVITLNSIEEFQKFLGTMESNGCTGKAEDKKDIATDNPITVQKTAEPQGAPVQTQAPAAVPAVSRQDIQKKAIALMDTGKQKELQELLKKYNVPALPSIPDDQLSAFMADLEVL